MYQPRNTLMSRPAELLASHEMFRTLPAQERTFLAKRMYARTFQRGETLIRQSEPIDVILFIASGLVSVVQLDITGHATELAQLGDGALVGELSLLTGNLPNANVTALIECEVWALNRADFEAVLQRSVPLAMSVNRMLSSKLAYANQRLTPRRNGQWTAILDENGEDFPLVATIAERVAYYTCDPVVVIDGYPAARSPLRRAGHQALSIAEVLQNPESFPYHAGVREIIVVSAAEGEDADSSQILTAATYLRTVFKHIIFALPTDQSHLLEDILPLADKVMVHIHRTRLGKAERLLRLAPLHARREQSTLVVSAWDSTPKLGDVRRIKERLGWEVAAIVSMESPLSGIDKAARTIAKLRVGLAWGGGTARGWALAGIANALEAIGVPMDFFAGTSAGALGAAVYGLSLNYQEAGTRMRRILPYLERTTRLMPPITISAHSLLRQGWWNDLIKTFVGELTFDDLLLPFAAVALDLHTGMPKIFESGLLWQAIRASSSVPVLAPPMMIDGRAYADGGVVNAVPLDVVSAMGADILIGIDLTGREREEENWGKGSTPNMLGTLTRTINVAYNISASRTLPLANVLIRPSLRAAAVYDVRVMDEFMAEGERAAYAALPDLKKVLKWLE